MSTDAIYQKITDRMIAMLDSDLPEWSKSWQSFGKGFPLRSTGQRYSGINVLTLWFAAQDRGYSSRYWMTYRQAADRGGQVRKGEKSELVIFASAFEAKQDDGSSKRVPFMKSYPVFNADQIDGLSEGFYVEPADANKDERIGEAEGFFSALGLDLRHGGDRAFYSPPLDYVQMPAFEQFRDAESYYAILAHEAVHWTGAKHRLDRLDPEAIFGSLNYAEEELVAELGAAFTMAHLGLSSEPRVDHVQYLQAWLAKLKGDKKFVVKAASAAEKAMQFLINKAAPAAATIENAV